MAFGSTATYGGSGPTFRGHREKGETSDAYAAMSAFALKIGAYKEARSYLQRALQRSTLRKEIIYTFLCKTWVVDHHPDGVQWATEGLQAWVEVSFRYPSPDGSLGTLLHRLGPMERIFPGGRPEGDVQETVNCVTGNA